MYDGSMVMLTSVGEVDVGKVKDHSEHLVFHSEQKREANGGV